MVDSALADFLRDKYAFANVEELTSTDNSTVYSASNTWGTNRAEVELFDRLVLGDEAAAVEQYSQALPWMATPAVVTLRDFGLVDGTKLFVVRDVAEGTPLSEMVEGRMAWGSPFEVSEVETLLAPIADALDIYEGAGKAGWLARSVNLDRILVQSGSADSPTKLAFVGPQPGGADATAHDNKEALARIIGELLGAPINRELLADTSSAREYLSCALHPDMKPAPKLTQAVVADELPDGPDESAFEAPAPDDPAIEEIAEQTSWSSPQIDVSEVGESTEDVPRYQASSGSGASGDAERTGTIGIVDAQRGGADAPRSSWSSSERTGGSTSVSADSDRPKQFFPETDPGMPAVSSYPSQQPAYAPAAAPAPAQPKKKAVWPWVLLTLLVIFGLAGGAGYYWYSNYGPGAAWQGSDAALADKFPAVISSNENGSGPWQQTRCESKTAETSGSEKAKITCANSRIGVSVVDYGSTEARDESLPDAEPKALEDGDCKVDAYDMNRGGKAYKLAPKDSDKSQYVFIVFGPQAADLYDTVGICK